MAVNIAITFYLGYPVDVNKMVLEYRVLKTPSPCAFSAAEMESQLQV